MNEDCATYDKDWNPHSIRRKSFVKNPKEVKEPNMCRQQHTRSGWLCGLSFATKYMRRRFAIIQIITVIVLLAVMFNTQNNLGYFGRFTLMMIIIVLSGILSRRIRCPKCNQPIGEGPIVGVSGWHYCAPPKKNCRFCGERLQ